MTKIKSEAKQKKPIWLKYTDKEVKEIILLIAKKNPELTAEKIGLILRDTYGIPKTRIYGFKISGVLKKADLYKDPDTENLNKKIKKLEAHIQKNKQDKRTRRAYTITKAKQKKNKEYKDRRR